MQWRYFRAGEPRPYVNKGNDNDNVNNNARVGADQCVCPSVGETTDLTDSHRLFLGRERELLMGGHVGPYPTVTTGTTTGTN